MKSNHMLYICYKYSYKSCELMSKKHFLLLQRVLYKKADGTVDEEVWDKEEEDDEEVF